MTLGPGRANRRTCTLGPVVSSFHLLRRLQRHGVPGRAPSVAVPVDRTAATRNELAGVFAAVEPVVQECRAMVEAATAEARDTLEQARLRSQLLLDEASARAAGVAAAEAAAELARLEREADEVMASSRAEADRVEARAAAREKELTDRIVSYTLSLPVRPGGAR